MRWAVAVGAALLPEDLDLLSRSAGTPRALAEAELCRPVRAVPRRYFPIGDWRDGL